MLKKFKKLNKDPTLTREGQLQGFFKKNEKLRFI